MEEVMKHGLMVHHLKVNMLMVKRKVKVHTNGLMDLVLQEVGLRTKLTDMEFINGLMVVDLKVAG